MDTQRQLLFAAMALQTGLIDAQQFAEAGRFCAAQRDISLQDELLRRGWIVPEDIPPVEYLVRRALERHDNDAAATLAARPTIVRGSLAALEAIDYQSTLAAPITAAGSPAALPTNPASQGRYTFKGRHAAGGLGQVWLARDDYLKRDVAIKELLPGRAGNATSAARFIREAQLTGQLEHPGVVPVYDLVSQPDNRPPFYSMRFVHGQTLSSAIEAYHAARAAGRAEPMEFVRLLTAFVVVCNTIAYAHSRGILHRDLKGDNVILGDFGEVIVLDWGLAKVIGQPDEDESNLSPAGSELAQGAGLTVQGEVIGTPAYMAPEQAEGRLDQIDQRTDIYGLGAMLYEILTGQPPFVGSTSWEVLKMAIRGQPPRPREIRPNVPPALEEVCLKAMAKDPAQRFASAVDLAQEVQRWQDVQRRQAEEALRQQTIILRSILDGMSEAVLVVDAGGKLMLRNPAVGRIIGQPAEPTLTAILQANEFYQPDGVTLFDAPKLPLIRAFHGEELDDAEMFIRPCAGGEGIWTSANARPLRDETGNIRASVIVLRDITERKRVEAELLRSRERFELAVRGSQDGLWDWDLQTNDVYYSPRWKSILGYEDHEIAHRIEEWDVRLHPEERERVLAANFAHIEGTTPHYEYEYRLRHKNGSYRWILARGVALRDATGKAYRMAGSHVDITEHKRNEQALRESEERYQAVLEALPMAVVVHNTDGTVAASNQAAQELLGLGPSGLNGCAGAIREDGSVLSAQSHPTFVSLQSGRPGTALLGLLRPGGERIWVRVSSSPLRRSGKGQPYAVVTTYEDVTSRTKVQGRPQQDHA